MAVDRKEAIAVLEEIALLLELKGENPFKIRAYTNAARALPALDGDFVELVRSGELATMKGFGQALVSKLSELVETGTLQFLVELRQEFPATLGELLTLNGVGPKKVKLFYDELQVTSIDELSAACADGRIAALPGCGTKTAEKIMQAIDRNKENAALFHFDRAVDAADDVVNALRQLPEIQRISVAGSLRRYKEVTKDIDLIASSSTPSVVMDTFVAQPNVDTVLAHGETKSSVVLRNGLQIDLRIVPDDVFPYALHHFTGSKEHNVAMRSRALKRGLKLSEWGLFKTDTDDRVPCEDEAALFAALGLQYIIPELREDLGEVDYADGDIPFPSLVQDRDYRGVLHCHSLASDGRDSVDALVEHARSMGHHYLGVTDHSVSSFQARGLSPERLLEHVADIRRVQRQHDDGFTLFAGIECDIRTDGELDYSDDILAQLDFVIVSVHNAFTQSEADMTRRVIRAIEHPASRILAHPTGRLLLKRDAYAIDLDKVIDAAIANNVAIELNCNPWRLDMEWRRWRKARDKGVLCTVNPDAHYLQQFDFITLGLGFCRKGWLTADDIINCWPVDKLKAFFSAE